MQSDQTFLDVGARPHLLGAAEENANLARSHFLEEGVLGGVGFRFLNPREFRPRDAQLFQFPVMS